MKNAENLAGVHTHTSSLNDKKIDKIKKIGIFTLVSIIDTG